MSVSCSCLFFIIIILYFFFLFSKLVVPKSDHFSGGGPISVRYIRMKIVRAQQNASSSRERILVPDDN